MAKRKNDDERLRPVSHCMTEAMMSRITIEAKMKGMSRSAWIVHVINKWFDEKKHLEINGN